MKHLLVNIIFILLLFNCSCKKKVIKITKPAQSTIDEVVIAKKTKDSIINNNGFLSELKFQKDSVYFINYNANKKLILIDTKTQNGFIRKYYCKNKLIDSLKITDNKIQEGLFLDGKIEGNEVVSLFSLAVFKGCKKNGDYIEFDDVSGVSLIGNYIDDKKVNQWLYRYTNGKWSGTVCEEKFDNGITISKDCDYYDWESKLNNKLSIVDSGVIKCLSY